MTPIRKKTGGKRVEDVFKVISHELVEKLLEAFGGAVYLRPKDRAALMLTTPLTFRFIYSPETLKPSFLVATGHLVKLTATSSKKTKAIFRAQTQRNGKAPAAGAPARPPLYSGGTLVTYQAAMCQALVDRSARGQYVLKQLLRHAREVLRLLRQIRQMRDRRHV